MARGTMHAGKPEGQRRRRNAPTHDTVTITADDTVRGPAIEAATGRATWSDAVLAWWHTWRTSPQAQVFETTDWQRLAVMAPLMESYFGRPSAAALSEIRLNEERLGATVVDRMRARLRIEHPAEPDGTPAGVVSMAARRDEMRKRLQGDS